MPIPDDVDPDLLISRLAGPLAPDMRQAFRRAAEDALARVPCQAKVPLSGRRPAAAGLFDPPDDRRIGPAELPRPCRCAHRALAL